MKNKKQRKKQLTIISELWDYMPSLKAFETAFESQFISFYKPWLQGDIDPKKIISFNEKPSSPLGYPFRLISRTRQILRVINNFNPDFVVTHHDEATISMLATMFICRLQGKKIKFVSFMRAGASNYRDPNLYTKVKKIIIRLFYSKIDLILTPSMGNCKELKKMFAFKNIKHLYNPADTAKYIQRGKLKIQNKKHQDIFKNNVVFTTVGRLTEQKGQWYLIRAFSQIVKKYPKAKLIIMGDGPLKTTLQQFIDQLNLQDHIFLIGNQKNPYQYLSRSYAFILPSIWESFGNVIVESMPFDIPIVTTDCKSGPREIMIPHVTLTEKIQYPKHLEWGMLITPPQRTYLFKSVQEVPLTQTEQQIVQIVQKLIVNKTYYNKHRKGSKRIKDFSISTISKHIEELLL